MKKNMKILVATDGSDHSLRAIQYAARLGDSMKTPPELTLINVHDQTGLRHARKFAGSQAVDEYLRELADEDLRDGKAFLTSAGLPYVVEARTGHVSREIIEFANIGHFDMVILGAKGRSAMTDFLVGSVAQRVVAGSSVPVLLVK